MSVCSEEICNGNGKCVKVPLNAMESDLVCECKENYDGRFCERCANSSLAYPDCSPSHTVDIYDEVLDKEYLMRRQYNKDGYYKPKSEKHQ